MLVLRPSRLSDLPGVEVLATQSPAGVTSLPDNREALYKRIQASLDSFAADVSFHGEERYFFVLEDTATGEVAGVSGIVASAGFNEPFYSYRNETLIHASPGLGIHNKVHALSLCHDLTGNTLLNGFYCRDALDFTPWSDLLSRARLLFIAQWPERFAQGVVSEMLGVNRADGSSPFWDAVGRNFFGIDYQQAEFYCGVKGRKFISELMPQHPIYVPLLGDEAQEVMGQINPASAVPFDVLTREGFETENYVDIFDGGPTLYARTAAIRTIAQSRLIQLVAGDGGKTPYLLATTSLADYRCTVADAQLVNDSLVVSQTVLTALGLKTGDTVRIAPL